MLKNVASIWQIAKLYLRVCLQSRPPEEGGRQAIEAVCEKLMKSWVM